MLGFSIRKATIEDADKLAFVRITGWKQSYKGMMPDELLARLDMEADAKRVRTVMEDGKNKSLRFIVEVEGKAVGMGACGMARGDENPKRAEIYAIYLLDEAKKQGIGSAFLREMGAELLANGAESLQVSVLEKNVPARNFYEKLGGKLIKKGIFKFEGYELPDVTYVWPDLKALLG